MKVELNVFITFVLSMTFIVLIPNTVKNILNIKNGIYYGIVCMLFGLLTHLLIKRLALFSSKRLTIRLAVIITIIIFPILTFIQWHFKL